MNFPLKENQLSYNHITVPLMLLFWLCLYIVNGHEWCTRLVHVHTELKKCLVKINSTNFFNLRSPKYLSSSSVLVLGKVNEGCVRRRYKNILMLKLNINDIKCVIDESVKEIPWWLLFIIYFITRPLTGWVWPSDQFILSKSIVWSYYVKLQSSRIVINFGRPPGNRKDKLVVVNMQIEPIWVQTLKTH